MMRLLNTKEYEGKVYGIDDVRGFISNESKGLPIGFYGGRIDRLGKTDQPGLYLCMEGMEVIDLIVDDKEFVVKVEEEINLADFEAELEGFEPLEDKTNKELAEMLETKGIEVPKRANKQDLLDLLKS